MFLCLPDIRDTAQTSLPSYGAEVCERNHTAEKSTGNAHVYTLYKTGSHYFLFAVINFIFSIPKASNEARNQLHLQGQKGQLSTECRSTFREHQNQ